MNLIGIANVYYSTKQLYKSLILYKEAEKLILEIYGQNHFLYAGILVNIANICFAQN